MMDLSGDDFASTGIDALTEMKEYSEYHFAREEEIMAACGFPELEMHKKLHHVFFREIEAMIEDMQSGNHILNSEIIKRIENWLRQHILEEDQKLKKIMDQQSS
jgi:hemerythrin